VDDAREDARIRLLAQQVMVPGAAEPFGAYMFGTDEPGADLGRYVERRVFLESFGNTPELLAEEYDPYEASSLFICVIDHLRALPVGVIRILMASEAGFKSLKDLEPVWGEPAEVMARRTGLDIDPETTWDIATLAVHRDYRSKAAQGLVSMGLYQTIGLVGPSCGIQYLVAILDMPVFRILRWKLHMVFVGYKGVSPRPYLGSEASMPAWCDLIEAERRIRVDPDLHSILFRGTGLEAALRPVDLRRSQSLVA
jgi:hypothetical protein